MLLVSSAQVQTAYSLATSPWDPRASWTLNAAVPGASLAAVLKLVIIFSLLLFKAKLDAAVWVLFQNAALNLSSYQTLEPHNVNKRARTITKTGIERELSLGCAFTYQPAAFGRRPAWQMGPGSRAGSGAVGDN